jgi:uncharacterized 2Fe-2S/4Fe-4S cluster protein (DUF4445 family)
MSATVRIELEPLGKVITVEKGAPLQDALFAEGVEFPCGGRGRCRGCKIRLLQGELPVTPDETRVLAEAEIAAGWRLACRARAVSDLKIDLAQWETTILADHASVLSFVPQEGLGVAVDLGTTTLVAQLLDLQTGHVLAVRMALNGQARHGADIMSRVEFAVAGEGRDVLTGLIRDQLGGMIAELLKAAGERHRELRQVVVVGNTVMHHLFCGIDLAPLAHSPFQPTQDGLQVFRAGELGWTLQAEPAVHFLPCLGGFVGSDILAGILATRLHESETLCALIDLGTNGEIVVGNRDRLVCASTAAGPAFEGARISMGMRAATGAISAVSLNGSGLECHILGDGEPRGICGSGLVDAVACGLDLGRIKNNGRLADGSALLIASPVSLTQADIRELQLAKGAIAAGVEILVSTWGGTMEDVAKVYLAGAFGNYINRTSARRIGMIDFPLEKVEAAGNTALLGAKLALFASAEGRARCDQILARQRHICLHEDPLFQDTFVERLLFP